MTQSCNSQPQHPEHPAQPQHTGDSGQPQHTGSGQPQHTGDSGQGGNCAPGATNVNVAPAHDGGWNAAADAHQAALISADVMAHVNSHETLDASASVLQCEVLDAHAGLDLSSDHA
jgi:hypothetical protein